MTFSAKTTSHEFHLNVTRALLQIHKNYTIMFTKLIPMKIFSNCYGVCEPKLIYLIFTLG